MTTRTREARSRRWFGIVFGVLVALCLAQIAWWIIFQLQEAERLQAVSTALGRDDIPAALEAFGAGESGELRDEAVRRRFMFMLEGATLGSIVLTGIVFLYRSLVRERRMRREHERFLTGATHELKTPLATIRLGIESLGMESLPPERRDQYLQGMLRESDRLETGLTNLLVAAGLDHTERSERSRGDLADDLRRVAEQFRERCETASLELRISPLEHCEIERDPQGIHLVLHNLLDNAVKFSEAGGSVAVSLRRQGKLAVVTIEDQGCGIEASEMPRIFDRFHRAGPDHVGGTGLGLALVREITEQHGGRVGVSSHGPDTGSKFEVSLPLAPEIATEGTAREALA